MATQDVSPPSRATHPSLTVVQEATQASAQYERDFTIGRDASCTLTIDSGLVSRIHARVVLRDGRWRVEDLDSTNGLYLDGERVDTVDLDGPVTVRLGANGPRLHLRPQPQAAAPQTASPSKAPSSQSPNRQSPNRQSPKGSVTAYLNYYFQGDESEGGEHTRLLRKAYRRARHTERRRFLVLVAGVLGVCLVLAVVALWQYQQRERLEGLAEQVFLDLKRQDLALAQFRLRLETDRPIADDLLQRERERRMLAARYTGYVQELGLHRRLSPEEQIIHSVARIFGESEFSMPAGFVREVRATIHDYWLGPGRARYERAVKRAQSNGYVEPIVHEMMRRGLPPEFFYLALQESDFRTDAVGPRTRWGIAKGMWQFIPSTARLFGLTPGPRADDRVYDPADDRHDFRASTGAAARYLQTIYTTEAQASGLLVIASYNWGEHRVTRKLSQMDDRPAGGSPMNGSGDAGRALPGNASDDTLDAAFYGIPEEAFAGMAPNPGDRNYWRFLTEYRTRIPEETRAYVLRVFAAAVIGQDPRHFGFDFDDPLQAAIESFDASLLPASDADSGS
jgi:hypothetical protein